MRTDPVVIDLGVIDVGAQPGGPEPAPAEPAPPPAPPPQHPLARMRRWWPLAALTLVLLASTSAADATSTGLVPLFHVDAEQRTSVALTDQVLYVATGTPAGISAIDPRWSLSAYRLADGALLWTVPHDPAQRHGSIAVRVLDGVPVVTGWRTHTAQMSRPPVHVDARSTAYEPGDGTVRWSHPGFLTAEQPTGRVVLDEIRYLGSDPPMPVEYLTRTVAVADGALLWEHQLPLDSDPDRYLVGTWALAGDGRHLAVLGRGGRLVVHDLATGAEAASHVSQQWHDASLLISGDTLRVSMRHEQRRTVAVHDLFPPVPRWSMTDLSPTTTLTFCGPVLCLHGTDGLAGLDPHDGHLRWRGQPGWGATASVPAPWPAGLVQVDDGPNRPGQPTPPERLIVDAATGERAVTLGRWLPLPGGEQHPYPLAHQRDEPAHRPGHPDYDPGRLWLGHLDATGSRVEVLGHLDQVTSCAVGRWQLACVTTGEQVAVWRLAS